VHARAAGAVAGVLIASVVFGAGCSDVDSPQSTASPLSVTGPWASEFKSAYADADSDYERGVLADGEVTAAEYEQSRNHVRSCLADSGLTIAWDDRGGFELGSKSGTYPGGFFERADPILQKCEKHWAGWIPILYEQIRRNPQKQDEAALQIACLKAAGLIDGTYTKAQWQRDNENDSLPFDGSAVEAMRCALDPLGLWYSG
jgi:hypothetical protein